MRIYYLLDTVAEKPGPVFEQPNDASALRFFKQVQFPKGVAPEDFQLMRITEFTGDTETAMSVLVDSEEVQNGE